MSCRIEAPTAERSANMARIRCRDTKPELALRGALRAAGLTGYRKNLKGVPGTPDVAYTKYRVAVFVDGDFWHGRDFAAKRDQLASGHNGAYWTAKIEANMARDRRTDAALAEAGWAVLRFWGSDVLKDPGSAAASIGEVLRRAGRRHACIDLRKEHHI